MVGDSSALQLPKLLALVLTIAGGNTQTAVITPLSYTARLGSIGTFHCAATGHHVISWYVNGVPSTYSVIRNRQITATDEAAMNATWSQSSLTVYASQENDGISIRCVAVVIGGRDGFSPTAIFHVQRQPLPPINLTLEVSEDHRNLMLRWNPPPGMSVSSTSHNIIYTVYVNISCTGGEVSLNTTRREYTLENPCTDVLFRVTAWDNIGEGNGTTLLYRHNCTGKNPDMMVLDSMKLSITFAESGELRVQVMFQTHGNCFHQILQDEQQLFLVETWSDCSGSRHHQGPMMLEPTIVNSTVTLVIPHLLPKCHIMATIKNQELSNPPKNITFATYGVQGAEISEVSLLNSICITCVFAQGTSAHGCYISLLENYDSVVTNVTGLRIEREGDSLNVTGCIENLEGGLYHVVVYDIEANGTVDWQNRALFFTAALNWTISLDHPSTATYDVEDAAIYEGSLLNSICITCVFAQKTSAQGCYISLLKDHHSMATNTSGLRIERQGDSLNATGCVENLEGGLYHVVVYDIKADGTVDWNNRALFLTAALNFTASPEQQSTSKNGPDGNAPSANTTLHEDSMVLAIAGSAVGGALLLVVTIGVLLCTLIMKLKLHSATDKLWKMKQTNHANTDDIEMKKNEIYGQPPQQQVVRNPAYNWWKLRGS